MILNACYSKKQAEAITQVIDCAIGMNDAIGDEAAITFAASFYRAIGFTAACTFLAPSSGYLVARRWIARDRSCSQSL